MQGVLRCARYAFSPNKLKYCGPDKNSQLEAYVLEGVGDKGLEELLDDFKVMYPYLKLIAEENNLADPFDEKVVEAYWVGNELLEGVSLKGFWEQLSNKQRLKDRFSMQDLNWLVGKVPKGAKVHHSFHVFNIWNRTGHVARPHTVETMNECRIAVGKVVKINRSNIKIATDKLVYKEGRLSLEPVVKKISWRLGDKQMVTGLKKGDWVSVHWGWVCEKLAKKQVDNLRKYSLWHLQMANETI